MLSRLLWVAGPLQYRRMKGAWLRWEFVGETDDAVLHRWTLWFQGSPGTDFSVAEHPDRDADDQAHLAELRELYRRVAVRNRRLLHVNSMVDLLRSMVPASDLAEATRMKASRRP